MARAVYLVRHGDRRDLADGTWSRSAARPHDTPLSPTGIAQSRVLATRLRGAHIPHVFSSPFLRCVQTADVVAEVLATTVKIEVGLSEWLSSTWFSNPPETASLRELCSQFARIDPAYVSRGTASYGESGEDALRRSGRTLIRLLSDFRGDLLLVGHGASILGGVAALLQVDAKHADGVLPEIACASVTRLSFRRGRWTLDLACDVRHLASPV